MPSDKAISIVACPYSSGFGVNDIDLLVPEPAKIISLFENNAPLDDIADNNNESALLSMSFIVKLIVLVDESSAIVLSVIFESIGASFTFVTVRINESVTIRLPSDNDSNILACPNSSDFGFIEIDLLVPEPEITISSLETNALLEDIADNNNESGLLSMSFIVKLIEPVDVSSAIVLSVIFERFGASFILVTVRMNESVTVRLPSVNANIIDTCPNSSVVGVIEIVLFVPEPPRVIFCAVTNV